MNRYIMIRRLRGPAFLLLLGVAALLHQLHLLTWGRSWPLFLILWGVLLLAERAALPEMDLPPYPDPGFGPYPAPGMAPYPVPGMTSTVAPAPVQAPVPTSAPAPVPTVETQIEPIHEPVRGDEITHRGTNDDASGANGDTHGGGQL